MMKVFLNQIKRVQAAIVYTCTCLSVISYLCGIQFVQPYWYFILVALCLVNLLSIKVAMCKKYKTLKILIVFLKSSCVLMLVIVSLLAFVFYLDSPINYMHSPNSKHVVTLEEAIDNLHIYEKHGMFKIYIDSLESYKGHPFMSVELQPRYGNVFKGSYHYDIGKVSFNWEDEDTLKISYGSKSSLTVHLGN